MLLQFVVVNLITKFTRGKLSTNISLIWRIVGWSLIAKVHGVQFYCLLLNLIKMIVLILIIFIWRLCISYRLLNSIIRSFEPLTPRCTNSIENLGDSYGLLSTSGYHQVNVIPYDQDKLAFFAPYSKNKCLKSYLLASRIHRHSILPRWIPCVRNGCSYLLILRVYSDWKINCYYYLWW